MSGGSTRGCAQAARQKLTAAERRQQLFEAAIRVFARSGFSGAKTREIAAEAGVNEALLFRHFSTKEKLYAAILEGAAIGEWLEAVRAAAAQTQHDPEAFIKEYARATLAWHRKRPEVMRLVFYSALEQHELSAIFRERQTMPILEIITEYFAARQAEGKFTSEVPPETAARLLYGTVAHQGILIVIQRATISGVTDEDTVDAVARITLKGLEARG